MTAPVSRDELFRRGTDAPAGGMLLVGAVLAVLGIVLFALQLTIPIPEVRVGFGALYILLAIVWFVRERQDLPVLWAHARATARGEGEVAAVNGHEGDEH